jgi:hypothetical protein
MPRVRSNEIFARMTPAQAQAFLADLRQEAPTVGQMALAVAANSFRLRLEYLRRQPRAKQAEWLRKALARSAMAGAAEEILAEYFLGHHKALLIEWLDAIGIKHEDGVLTDPAPACPDLETLQRAVEAFRRGDNPERRNLLLAAFASQSAIDWPALDQLLQAPPAPAAG